MKRKHGVLTAAFGILLAVGTLSQPAASAIHRTATLSTAHLATSHVRKAAAPRAERLTIGSHNTLHGHATMGKFADVIGWQEVDTAAGRTKLVHSMSGYRIFWPRRDSSGSIAISWNNARFRLLKDGSVKTIKGQKGVTPARYINWVLLQDRKTGRDFIFVNTHFISAAWTRHPERRARWERHATILHRTVYNLEATYRLPVFVVGDFNCPHGMKLRNLVQLRNSGSSAYPGYDQVYVYKTVTHGLSWVLPKSGSDHNGRKAFLGW